MCYYLPLTASDMRDDLGAMQWLLIEGMKLNILRLSCDES